MKKLLTILFAVALGLNLSAQTVCSNPQDANQDGVIGVDDLMDLLSNWGDTDFDFDGVYDSVDLCTDEGACNYLSNPTEACIYLDAIGDCGGDCAEDIDGDGSCDEFFSPCQGEGTLTYQDYTYDLVVIGDQCWFAENLRSENYENGDAIPSNLTGNEWETTNSGAVAVLSENTINLSLYGRVYNWYAVDDVRGLCPSGWHVPLDSEWTMMTDFLGGESVAGVQMKTTYGWYFNGNGTNSSGFSGLPSGLRSSNNGGSYFTGQYGYCWSSSPIDPDSSWYRSLVYYSDILSRGSYNLRMGLSVRCLKD